MRPSSTISILSLSDLKRPKMHIHNEQYGNLISPNQPSIGGSLAHDHPSSHHHHHPSSHNHPHLRCPLPHHSSSSSFHHHHLRCPLPHHSSSSSSSTLQTYSVPTSRTLTVDRSTIRGNVDGRTMGSVPNAM
ncbi:hypothetical protein Dimus_004274 [Dionaea muscipula]